MWRFSSSSSVFICGLVDGLLVVDFRIHGMLVVDFRTHEMLVVDCALISFCYCQLL